jgi:hypothetical protein
MLGQLATGSIGPMLQRRAAVQNCAVQRCAVVAVVGDTTDADAALSSLTKQYRRLKNNNIDSLPANV